MDISWGIQIPQESWRILCCESAQTPFFRTSLLLDESDILLPHHFLAPNPLIGTDLITRPFSHTSKTFSGAFTKSSTCWPAYA